MDSGRNGSQSFPLMKYMHFPYSFLPIKFNIDHCHTYSICSVTINYFATGTRKKKRRKLPKQVSSYILNLPALHSRATCEFRLPYSMFPQREWDYDPEIEAALENRAYAMRMFQL